MESCGSQWNGMFRYGMVKLQTPVGQNPIGVYFILILFVVVGLVNALLTIAGRPFITF